VTPDGPGASLRRPLPQRRRTASGLLLEGVVVVRARIMVNRVIRACREEGSYTLSAGTMDPAVVLERLLDALALLDSAAHSRFMEPGGRYSAIPLPALDDEQDSWWESDSSIGFIETVIGVINVATAPHGLACSFADADRFELVCVEPDDESNKTRTSDLGSGSSRPPSSVTALRAHVRSHRRHHPAER
jgi:hypothetical protein